MLCHFIKNILSFNFLPSSISGLLNNHNHFSSPTHNVITIQHNNRALVKIVIIVINFVISVQFINVDHLCGLVVRVLGYRSGGPGSIPGTTRKKSSGSGMGSTQPCEHNWGGT
jgi:hypothetical protein